MNIKYFENKEEMIGVAANLLITEIKRNPKLLLCAATGSSPLELYGNLAKNSMTNNNLYRQLRIVKLDEWLGLKDLRGSCEAYLQQELLKPLGISKENYIAFDAQTQDPKEECLRIQDQLKINGSIDICVLGLGKNGHLGFNEPGLVLEPNCHIAQLTTQSQHHHMVAEEEQKPKFGITLGMKDIVDSKRILLIVSGKEKELAKRELFSGKINTQCPASLLWLHNNVDCFVLNE